MNNGGKYQGTEDFEVRKTRRRRRRLLLVLVPAFLGCSVPNVGPASALALDAGVCLLDIEVTSADVPLVPADRTWDLGGGGTCTTTLGGLDVPTTVDGTLSGPLGQPTVGCALAVLTGTVKLTIDDPAYSDITLTSVGLVAGAVVVLTGADVSKTVVVAGAGAFVQDVDHTKECLLDQSIDAATWSGAFVFADPVL